jgi:hypothetical protein
VVVEIRERHSSDVARGWFAEVRHLPLAGGRGEPDRDATAGVGRVIIGG